MTNEQLERGQILLSKINSLEELIKHYQQALNGIESENEAARTYIRIVTPSDSTLSLNIRDSVFNKEVLSMYIRKIDLEIVKLKEEFKAL